MPKPQKLTEIPTDIDLFQIPRKKAPVTESTPPPPPPPSPSHSGGGGKPDPQLKYWEQKVKEHAAENLKLHQQLDAVTKHRDQLLGVLSNQQQGNAEVEELRVALESESVNARQLEQQLVHLQQRSQDFNGKLAEKDQDVAAARQRTTTLEHQLTQSNADLARLRSELETSAEEHDIALSDLRAQLTEARQSAEAAESSLREQTDRARDVSTDLANLRVTHQDLQRQWDESRKSLAEVNKRNDELEQRLADRARDASADVANLRVAHQDLQRQWEETRKSVAEVNRRKDELEQRLADRVSEIQHLRAELDRRGTAHADEFALRTRLKEELRHEYNARVAAEHEAVAASRRQNFEVQERLNQTVKELDALKRRSIESTSAEAGIVKQLHAAQAMADKAQTNYGREAARANKLEKTVEALRQSKEELQEKASAERKEASKYRRKAELLAKRLSRKRFGKASEATDATGGDMDARVRDSVNALAKAAAELEVERRRLESAALQSRLPSLDATRVGQAFVNSLRSQLRPSADNLMESISRLLESSLEADQKRVAESAFENALLIQAVLQEGQSQSEPTS